MTDITRILSQIERGDATAGEQLLPVVYEELRRLAAAKLAHEKPGQTLQATALVHEAYLRLVGNDDAGQQWNGRGQVFGAAAETIRRILVERVKGIPITEFCDQNRLPARERLELPLTFARRSNTLTRKGSFTRLEADECAGRLATSNTPS